jgi:hypothetical protein
MSLWVRSVGALKIRPISRVIHMRYFQLPLLIGSQLKISVQYCILLI